MICQLELFLSQRSGRRKAVENSFEGFLHEADYAFHFGKLAQLSAVEAFGFMVPGLSGVCNMK